MRTAVFIALFAFLFSIPPQLIMAQPGTIAVGPGQNPATAKGMRIRIQNQWPFDGEGYYRIKVIMAINPPLTVASRTQSYNVVVSQRSYNKRLLTYTTPIVVEAGQSEGTAILQLPVSEETYAYDTVLHIESDGNLKLNDYDLFQSPNVIQFGHRMDSGPTMLIVSSAVTNVQQEEHLVTRKSTSHLVTPGLNFDESAFPSLKGLDSVYKSYNTQYMATNNSNKVSTTSQILESASVHAIPPSDFPESWTELSSVEMIVVPIEDLQLIAAKDGLAYKALRTWVAAGGTLVVSNCGTSFEKAETVRQLVPKQFQSVADRRTPWYVPDKDFVNMNRFIRQEQSYSNNAYSYSANNNEDEQGTVDRKDAKLPSKPMTQAAAGKEIGDAAKDANTPFVFYQYLHGRVVVVNEDMVAWTSDQWFPLFNLHNWKNRTITKRVSSLSEYSTPNLSFGIPGVNLPPARVFLCLIGLFVFFVGPFSYSWLKKRDRLQLLFITTPITSLIACAGLFLYATLADGFHNRGRMRSFTTIDHFTNQAVSFSRHSHYSGSQPGPYAFASSNVVFNSHSSNGSPTTMRDERDQAMITGGDIRTRMPHQLVSAKAFSSDEQLVLVPGDAGEAPKVQNRFMDDIEIAFFRTESGLFLVKDLKAGTTATAETTDELAVGTMIADTMRLLSPRIEGSTATTTTPAIVETQGDCDYEFDNLLFGKKLDRYLALNQYLAMFKSRSEIEKPALNIRYSHQLHVVHGKW